MTLAEQVERLLYRLADGLMRRRTRLVRDHDYKADANGACAVITEGATWTAFDPHRCRRPKEEHVR